MIHERASLLRYTYIACLVLFRSLAEALRKQGDFKNVIYAKNESVLYSAGLVKAVARFKVHAALARILRSQVRPLLEVCMHTCCLLVSYFPVAERMREVQKVLTDILIYVTILAVP
jgi:hypothetical protein